MTEASGRAAWETALARSAAEMAPALVEAHHAIHLVAAAGQAFAPHRADGTHRAMTWDPDALRFVGAAFDGAYPFRVALATDDLRLSLLERSGAALGEFELPGRTLGEAYEWLGKAATTYLGRPFDVVPRPDFAIEGHDHARRFALLPAADRASVGALVQIGVDVLDGVAGRRRPPAMVRCWAHDFDLSARLGTRGGAGDVSSPSVGVGMACGGGDDGAWYWYVDAWPRLDVGGLAPLAAPGRWHHAAWSGAILRADDVRRMDADARRGVTAFFDEAVDAVRRAMDPHPEV